MKRSLVLSLALLPCLTFANEKLPNCSPIKHDKYWSEMQDDLTKLSKRLSNNGAYSKERFLENYSIWRDSLITSSRELDEILVIEKSEETPEPTLSNEASTFIVITLTKAREKKMVVPKAYYTPNEEDGSKGSITFAVADSAETSVFTLKPEADAQCAKLLQCTSVNNNACVIYLETWTTAINSSSQQLKSEMALAFSKAAIALEKRWAKYHSDARYQYFWEQASTAYFLRNELSSDSYTEPPSVQFFWLHPWAAMEYVPDADDGSHFKAALTLEWAGINWWEECFWGTACGISAISTYSDRAGTQDFGHGIMVHIENQYSLGATWRSGGDMGFFISVDLLKAFEDTKSSVEGWQEKADKYLGE